MNRTSRRTRATLAVSALALAGGAALTVGLAGSAYGASARSSGSLTITKTSNSTWGTILAESNKTTVYRFAKDKKNVSMCSGSCTTIWPPVVLPKGQTKAIGSGVSGLGTIKRSNGQLQVTYEGVPLYTYIGDKKAGSVNGQIKDNFGAWYAVNPSSPLTAPKKKSSSSTTTTGGIAY